MLARAGKSGIERECENEIERCQQPSFLGQRSVKQATLVNVIAVSSGPSNISTLP